MSSTPGQHWEPATLETDDGFQATFRFIHPEREAGFPDMYQLQEPHPLRPEWFTPAHHPHCGRQAFNDYVITIHKTSDFMTSWKDMGEETATPRDDVISNEENGAHP